MKNCCNKKNYENKVIHTKKDKNEYKLKTELNEIVLALVEIENKIINNYKIKQNKWN